MTTNYSLMYHVYRGFWTTFDWLFPPVCGGCGDLGTRWCSECKKSVQLISDPVCDVCGLPQSKLGICNRCRQAMPSYKKLRSWTVFEAPVQNALHRLKYRRDIGLGEALANQMINFIEDLRWPVDMLIPIPLGKKRQKERGYNQVAMIAMPLSMQLKLDYHPSVLVRARETRSQVGLSATERKENVKDVFKTQVRDVSGRSILLMDDVSTTGATLSSAADALYASGARDVYAVTVARALPHHGLKIV